MGKAENITRLSVQCVVAQEIEKVVICMEDIETAVKKTDVFWLSCISSDKLVAQKDAEEQCHPIYFQNCSIRS